MRVGADYRVGGAAVRRAITRNTVLVVASSPGFPHGVVDHVTDIAKARPWAPSCRLSQSICGPRSDRSFDHAHCATALPFFITGHPMIRIELI